MQNTEASSWDCWDTFEAYPGLAAMRTCSGSDQRLVWMTPVL